MEAYQTDAGAYIGVAAVVEPSLCVPSAEDMGTEHSPLLEKQEEEELKVREEGGMIIYNYFLCVQYFIYEVESNIPYWYYPGGVCSIYYKLCIIYYFLNDSRKK